MRGLSLFILLIALGIFSWIAFGFFGVQTLFTDRIVQETLPHPVSERGVVQQPSFRTLAFGDFQQGDASYTISGKAFATQEGDVRTISLQDFSVSNGPDLFLYLVYPDSSDNSSVKEAVDAGKFVPIGRLKGNIGNQSYTLPPDISLHNATVSIWCQRFSRNFGMATLVSPPQDE